jgi:hypothetical protein
VQKADDVAHLLGKGLEGQRAGAVLERARRTAVGAGGAADAEVDAPGEERLQHAKVLGDLQRAVVREHHATGAHTDAGRLRGHLADEDFRRGAGEAAAGMVLGEPVAVIAEAVGGARELERVVHGVRGRAAGRNRRLIEDAQKERGGHHG